MNHDLLHTVFRSIMLAREGYTVLELGYNVPQYGHKDYYSRKKPFDLKYIEMAIRKVLNHHSVYGDKVAMVGQSKGAELATAAASLMPHLIELSVRFVNLILIYSLNSLFISDIRIFLNSPVFCFTILITNNHSLTITFAAKRSFFRRTQEQFQVQ